MSSVCFRDQMKTKGDGVFAVRAPEALERYAEDISDLLFKGVTCRDFLKKNTKVIPLNDHLSPSQSVWRCLYLQRPRSMPGFS